jgi:hypothetical protein
MEFLDATFDATVSLTLLQRRPLALISSAMSLILWRAHNASIKFWNFFNLRWGILLCAALQVMTCANNYDFRSQSISLAKLKKIGFTNILILF